jgi:hypothetical protein
VMLALPDAGNDGSLLTYGAGDAAAGAVRGGAGSAGAIATMSAHASTARSGVAIHRMGWRGEVRERWFMRMSPGWSRAMSAHRPI